MRQAATGFGPAWQQELNCFGLPSLLALTMHSSLAVPYLFHWLLDIYYSASRLCLWFLAPHMLVREQEGCVSVPGTHATDIRHSVNPRSVAHWVVPAPYVSPVLWVSGAILSKNDFNNILPIKATVENRTMFIILENLIWQMVALTPKWDT